MTFSVASLRVVLGKELRDGLRDRRSILSALMPLAILPLMTFWAMGIAADDAERATSSGIRVPVIGAERAQALVDWMEGRGVEFKPAADDPQEAVQAGEADFVLVIPEDFADRFARSRTAELRIVVDGSDRNAQRAAGRVRAMVREFSEGIASQRLIARGVSPEVIRPVSIQTVDLASRRERVAQGLLFIPMFLLMIAFVGGLQIAIDSTAGERERGSLEPLLANPVPRLSVVGGKWLAAVVFSVASLALTTAVVMLVLEHSPLRRLGLRLELGPGEVMSVLAAALPLALPASAIQMSVATLARSYKEAQAYVSFLMLIPMVPVILQVGQPLERSFWHLAVPIMAQHGLINDIVGGKPVDPLHLAVAGLSAAIVAFLFLWLTARQFRRERIVFGH